MKMEQKIEIKRKNWQKTHCDHTLTQMFKCFFEVMFDTIVSFIVWTFLFARMDSVHWTHIHTLLCTAHVWHFSSSVLAVMRPRNSSHEKSIIFSIGQWTTHIFTFSWSRNVADDLMNNRQVYMTVEVIGGIGGGGGLLEFSLPWHFNFVPSLGSSTIILHYVYIIAFWEQLKTLNIQLDFLQKGHQFGSCSPERPPSPPDIKKCTSLWSI